MIALSADRTDLFSAQVTRGWVLDEHLGEVDRAREHFQTALAVQPDQPWPYLALAELDLRGRRWSRAIAHVDHGLELCGPDAPERPWLLAIKGACARQVSLSTGPVSTFFRGLQVPVVEADPAESALRAAAERAPALAERDPEQWLLAPAELARAIREGLPRPAMPAWWFQG